MKSGMAAIAVFASLAIASTFAPAARASSAPAGNDISYPQCGATLPSSQAFGIVAVNDGLANTSNPCLAAEIAWAKASSGGTSQPKAALYVNTANPGSRKVADWPSNNKADGTGHHVNDPYGTCAGQYNQACAWQYGWNLAYKDARTSGISYSGRYLWWLDVETINSWQSSAPDNRADLEGMTTYFRGIGGTVGIYSTIKQWGPITGTIGSASPLYRLPDWIPGAKTLAQAKKNCRLAPLTGGGTVTVTQWAPPPPASSTPGAPPPANNDLSCIPPKAKAK
jgi:hypothetical protein